MGKKCVHGEINRRNDFQPYNATKKKYLLSWDASQMYVIKSRERKRARASERAKRVRFGKSIVHITATQKNTEQNLLLWSRTHNVLSSTGQIGKKITTTDKIHKLIEITIKITNFLFYSLFVAAVALNIGIVAELNAYLNNRNIYSWRYNREREGE